MWKSYGSVDQQNWKWMAGSLVVSEVVVKGDSDFGIINPSTQKVDEAWGIING